MNDTKTSKPRRRLDSRGKLAITRLSLHEQVVDQLRQMIVSGELGAGEKIRVGDLAVQLDVSLTPLREALKVLAGEQLVELMPNRGAIVAPITAEDTARLFEVIAGIEALAAELTATRIMPGALEQLEQMHVAMRECHEADNAEGYFTLNRKIHDRIVDHSGNPVLIQIRSQLAVRAERARFLSVGSGAHRIEAMQDHEGLMAALRARAPKAAHDAWRRHLIRSGEEICRLLRAREDEAQRRSRAAG